MGQTTKYHIVYPSDYTAVADIPEAMKDMAESTEDGIDQAVGEIDLSAYQTLANLVTTISSSSTDSQYPSAKCVYDLIGDLDTILQTLNNGGGVE